MLHPHSLPQAKASMTRALLGIGKSLGNSRMRSIMEIDDIRRGKQCARLNRIATSHALTTDWWYTHTEPIEPVTKHNHPRPSKPKPKPK